MGKKYWVTKRSFLDPGASHPQSATAGKTLWWGITHLACLCAFPKAATISHYQRQDSGPGSWQILFVGTKRDSQPREGSSAGTSSPRIPQQWNPCCHSSTSMAGCGLCLLPASANHLCWMSLPGTVGSVCLGLQNLSSAPLPFLALSVQSVTEAANHLLLWCSNMQ